MTNQNHAAKSHDEQDSHRKQGNGAHVGTQKYRAGDADRPAQAEQQDEPERMAG